VTRPPRTAPSLAEWAALGLLCESPAHGWSLARAFEAEGEIGRELTVPRALVYRALAQLRELGLVEIRETSPSELGPARTTLGATRRGRADFKRWLHVPVEHVRDLRSELMLKLLFHERSGGDPAALLEKQAAILGRTERSLERQAAASEGFDATLALWRLSTGRASLAFVEGLRDRRTAEPVVYRPIGYVRSPHATLDGMPLQPLADTAGPSRLEILAPHRESLRDLAGFSHAWVLAHLDETAGWDGTVPAFLDDEPRGTFATRSPRRPNPIGLSLVAIDEVESAAIVVAALDLLDGTPILDVKPYVPLFDRPTGAIRQGWFEGRAERVFERRSDLRFRPRSTTGE